MQFTSNLDPSLTLKLISLDNYFNDLVISQDNLDNNMIEIKELSFFFNKDSAPLKNLSLNIKKNTISGIIGRSGAGKTTLINLILGLLKINDGSIKINFLLKGKLKKCLNLNLMSLVQMIFVINMVPIH